MNEKQHVLYEWSVCSGAQWQYTQCTSMTTAVHPTFVAPSVIVSLFNTYKTGTSQPTFEGVFNGVTQFTTNATVTLRLPDLIFVKKICIT